MDELIRERIKDALRERLQTYEDLAGFLGLTTIKEYQKMTGILSADRRGFIQYFKKNKNKIYDPEINTMNEVFRVLMARWLRNRTFVIKREKGYLGTPTSQDEYYNWKNKKQKKWAREGINDIRDSDVQALPHRFRQDIYSIEDKYEEWMDEEKTEEE